MMLVNDRKVLLAVGRLGEEKNFARVMNAFAMLAKHYLEWDLFILGEDSERTALEALRDEQGLSNRIYLPGLVGNLADRYGCASLYVMNSRSEGFGNTLAEALVHYLPDSRTGSADEQCNVV